MPCTQLHLLPVWLLGKGRQVRAWAAPAGSQGALGCSLSIACVLTGENVLELGDRDSQCPRAAWTGVGM